MPSDPMSKEETMVERSMLQRCVNRMAGADVDLDSLVGQSYVEMVVGVLDELSEPTPEMLEAAQLANYSAMAKGASGLGFKGIFRAMLSKAKEGTGE